MEIKELQKETEDYTAAREWDIYHSPKNMALKLVLESAELLDLFEWMKEGQDREALSIPEFKEAAEEEFGDIFIILLEAASSCGVDIEDAFRKKMDENEKRFPKDKSREIDIIEWKLKKLRDKKKTSL